MAHRPTSHDGRRERHDDNAGHIVVGVDGSPSSLQALRWAVDQGALTGATVQAVIAWHVPNLYGYPMTDGEDWAADAQVALTTALDTVLGNDKSKVSSTVVQGYPAKALLDAAAGVVAGQPAFRGSRREAEKSS
jgi:nucleotide-binding universal stress UspA family protein